MHLTSVITCMEQFSEQQKQPVLKSLAIVGLVAALIAIAWVSVQLVNVLPGALNSLASLANSVYNYQPNVIKDLNIEKSDVLLTSGYATTIAWKESRVDGTYSFSYDCEPGVVVTLAQTTHTSHQDLACETTYDLGQVQAVDLTVETRESRFADLRYTLTFVRNNESNPSAQHTGVFSLVNDRLATLNEEESEQETPNLPVATSTNTTVGGQATSTTDTSPIVLEEPTLPPPPPVTTPVIATPEEPTLPTSPLTPPVYTVPVSDPNGFTDLTATLVGFGTKTPLPIITLDHILDRDKESLVQFVIHNIGTKTSNTWTWGATFPDGTRYTSPTQDPLKPNERSVITASFPATQLTGLLKFNITVSVTGDEISNNSITIYQYSQ